jgi:uncharacterized protein
MQAFLDLKKRIIRRPLLTYFVLSYAFFWLVLALFGAIAFGVLHLDPKSLPWLMPMVQIIGSWMPSLAAAIVVGAGEGREGIGRLFGMLIQFRVPARWVLAALIPIGFAVGAVLAYRVSGGLAEGGVGLTPAFWVSLVLVNLLTGPTGEEPGWRGFALPRLLQRFKPLEASLILGIIWSFWHLPLWLTSGYDPATLLFYVLAFIVGITSLNMLMTWIYLRISYSLVPMTIAHFTYNASFQLISPSGLGLGATVPLFGWMAGFALLTVVILWTLQGHPSTDLA